MLCFTIGTGRWSSTDSRLARPFPVRRAQVRPSSHHARAPAARPDEERTDLQRRHRAASARARAPRLPELAGGGSLRGRPGRRGARGRGQRLRSAPLVPLRQAARGAGRARGARRLAARRGPARPGDLCLQRRLRLGPLPGARRPGPQAPPLLAAPRGHGGGPRQAPAPRARRQRRARHARLLVPGRRGGGHPPRALAALPGPPEATDAGPLPDPLQGDPRRLRRRPPGGLAGGHRRPPVRAVAPGAHPRRGRPDDPGLSRRRLRRDHHHLRLRGRGPPALRGKGLLQGAPVAARAGRRQRLPGHPPRPEARRRRGGALPEGRLLRRLRRGVPGRPRAAPHRLQPSLLQPDVPRDLPRPALALAGLPGRHR